MKFLLIAQNELFHVFQVAVFSKRPVRFEFAFFQASDAFAELEEIADVGEFSDPFDLACREHVVSISVQIVGILLEIPAAQFCQRFSNPLGVAIGRFGKFAVRGGAEIFSVFGERRGFFNLGDEKSPRAFGMGPEFFLEDDFERSRNCRCRVFEHAFVFEAVERTGRIEHFPAGFQGRKPGQKQFLLKAGDGFDVFDVPIFERFFRLEADAFAGARGVQEYAVEGFRQRAVENAVHIGNARAVRSPHALHVFDKRRKAFFGEFVGYDEGVGEVFEELRGFSARRGSHVEHEERFVPLAVRSFAAFRQMPDAHRSREFLDVEIAHEVFERASEGGVGILAVDAERHRVFGGGERPSFRGLLFRERGGIDPFGIDAEGFFERTEERFLERGKFLGIPLEEFVLEILEERFGNRHWQF